MRIFPSLSFLPLMLPLPLYLYYFSYPVPSEALRSKLFGKGPHVTNAQSFLPTCTSPVYVGSRHVISNFVRTPVTPSTWYWLLMPCLSASPQEGRGHAALIASFF